MKIFAYNDKDQFSISFTIYDHLKNVKRRNFFLRNLEGATKEQRLEHAIEIANEVAIELRHLSGFGIDKVNITCDSKQVKRLIYPELRPLVDNEALRNSLKVTITFHDVFTHKWRKGTEESLWIDEHQYASQEWERIIYRTQNTKSFSFPSLLNKQCGFFSLLRYHPEKNRQPFNRADPFFLSFMHRFFDKGHLAFGDLKCWGQQGKNAISWNFWPEGSKLPKKLKHPKTSTLASQPRDATDYVYIIQNGRSTVCKIGISNDPQGRLATLQTANPHKLRIAHTFKAENASAAETHLHDVLRTYRMEGEWFELSREQFNRLCQIEYFKDQLFWINNQSFSAEELF